MGAGSSATKKAIINAEPQGPIEKKIDEVRQKSDLVEIDRHAQQGRKENRAYTVSIGKSSQAATAAAQDRREKRAATLPSGGHRRGDIELSEDIVKELAKKQEELKVRASRGSVFLGAAEEAEIDAILKAEASVFVHGVHTATMAPHSDREAKFVGEIGPSTLLEKMGACFTCVKGAKGAKDNSPNQDNFSITRHKKTGWEIYCVNDGHGPFGHFASLRTTLTLPFYIIKSEHFPNQMDKALEEAFLNCHMDLLGHALNNSYDVQASGTTCVCSVRLGNILWTAHTGDSRIVVGSEKDKSVKYETVDHKPDLPIEKERIENSGGEVRSFKYDDNWTVNRIFVRGLDYPGLCMSRSLGDECVKAHGVLAKPEGCLLLRQLCKIAMAMHVHKYTIDYNDKPFLIMATDGVWEFLTSEWVIKAIVKKLPTDGPYKCVQKLAKEAKRRWKQEENDYCDDVTALMVILKP